MINWLKGKKTYLVVASSLIYALLGFFVLHILSFDQFIQLVQVALGLGGLRAAISNSSK